MHAFQVLVAGVPDMNCSRVWSLILYQQCRLTLAAQTLDGGLCVATAGCCCCCTGVQR